MGNILKKKSTIKPEYKCLICWENIKQNKFVVCNQCNITMHRGCEKIYRYKKRCNLCPHCQRKGSLFFSEQHWDDVVYS
jgi:hypothetical protein